MTLQFTQDGGYDGYSMSNRARAAYADGLKPLYKLTAADLPDGWTLAKARAAAEQGVWTPAEWHHTGSKYNETNFYDPAELVEINPADIDVKPKADDCVKVLGYLGEWSGQGRRKSLTILAFKGEKIGKQIRNIKVWGLNGWEAFGSTKKAAGNWIEWRGGDVANIHQSQLRIADMKSAPAPRGHYERAFGFLDRAAANGGEG